LASKHQTPRAGPGKVMDPTIESTRFGQYCINVYRLGDSCYLVCGRQGAAESCFTQAVFRDCRRPQGNLIHTLQQHLRRFEESNDFQDWHRQIYRASWDPANSRCPLCFVACGQAAKELRKLMGPDYDRFLAASLEISVQHASQRNECEALGQAGQGGVGQVLADV